MRSPPLAEHRDGQYHLGVMYGTGNGVPTDFVKSAEWLRKAAKQGHVDAQATIGKLLLQGPSGVPKDYEEATNWLRRAADSLMHVNSIQPVGLDGMSALHTHYYVISFAF